MSTQPINREEVEQTKQQIRELVAELAQLSNLGAPPDQYYPQFLNRVVTALAAAGGAVWTREGSGPLSLRYQINLQNTGLHESNGAQQRHGKLLLGVMAEGRGALVPPQSGLGDGSEDSPANPTDYLLVLGVLSVDQEQVGVVEVFQRPGGRPTAQKGYLQFLNQMCGLASDYLKNRRLRHMVGRDHLWSRLENFAHEVHSSLRPKTVAYTVANDGRQFVECDRVSVALRHGRRTYIEAISGQDVVDRRANLVRTMAQLADTVIYAGEPLLYTGSTDDLPPRIENAIRDYVDESGSKTIYIAPLREPGVEPNEERHAFGALVVEQIEDNRPAPHFVERVEVVARHSATALYNAQRHERVFLLPLWHWIGEQFAKLRGRTLAQFVAVLVAIGVGISALAIVPAEFRLEGRGKLNPELRREVFANEPGIVREILVATEQRVKQGQPLVRLESNQLQTELIEATRQLQSTERQLAVTIAMRSGNLTNEEKIRVFGEVPKLEKVRDSYARQIQILTQRVAELEVLSPIDGIVTTSDIKRLLSGRAVQQGNLLLSVADDTGPWVLEVKMPEDKMGHILHAQRELPPGELLPVQYILATEPEVRYRGWVQEIGARTELMPDEGAVTLITVKLDATNLPPEVVRRPGAEVRGRIECGKRAVGYVWFHQLIEFVYARIVFRFFT